MGKWCAVPGCRTGSRTAEKRSVFRVPKDITTWKKWEQAIPGIVKLQQSDIVCEKHFNEEDIAREWVKFDANGRVIARVSYKYPQLKKLAVPTRFHDGKENCEPSQLDSSIVVDQNNGSIGAMFSFPMKSPLQGVSVYADINRVTLAVPNTGMSSSCMSASSWDHLGDNPLLSQRASNAYSSFENREQTFNLDRDERLVADSLERLEYRDHAYAKQMSHAQRNVIPETSTSADLARVPSPVSRIEIGLSLSPMDVWTCETSLIDSLTPETPDKLAISLEINKRYLCKQVLKKYKSDAAREEAVRLKSSCGSSESQLVALKSRGGLIHANHHFFHLIRRVKASFAKYSSRVDVFDVTLDEVLNTYSFTFPCKEHASETLSYAIVYYIRLRMRQNGHQENLKQTKTFVVKKKLAKFTNE